MQAVAWVGYVVIVLSLFLRSRTKPGPAEVLPAGQTTAEPTT
jgi:hypothetical protein